MKEEGKDHAVLGFKVASDRWHLVEFQDGIDYLPGKGGEGIYQNEKGFKTYKFQTIVKDENDPDNEAHVDYLVGMEFGESTVSNILACVGLWEAVCKKFPGKDVSVFDKEVMDGIKVKLPGRTLMMRTEIDKEGRARPREIASIAFYKANIQDKAKTSAKSGGVKKEEAKEEVAAAGSSDSWD